VHPRSQQNVRLPAMGRSGVLRWMGVVVSAGLQVVCFPIAGPVPEWRRLLAWIALVPLLLAILSIARDGRLPSLRRSFLLGYVCGILWYAGNCYWIYQTMNLYGGISKPASLGILFLFCLYLGLYHGLFTLLLRMGCGRPTSMVRGILAAPFLWVAVELARARITGFPWDQLGMTQVNHPGATWMAPIAGVYAISLVIAIFSAVLAAVVLFPSHRIRLCSILALAVLIAIFWRPNKPHPETYRQSAVLLQPNISEGRDSGWEGDGYARGLARSVALSEHPQDPFFHGSWTGSPTVIVWPESPAPVSEQEPQFRQAAQRLAQDAGSPLVLGNVAFADDLERTGHSAVYNSASFVTSQGVFAGRYDKIHLVPFGEFIPLQRWLSFAHSLTAEVGTLSRGQQRVVFTTGGHSYGVFICYESTFADEIRHFVLNGADVLVNISNDGWYGDTSAPWQHLDMARMRAIENHRWLLRDTNTGVTAAIDPDGRIIVSAPRHIETAIRVPFNFESGTTFYTRHGDWLAYACAIISFVLLLWGFVPRTTQSH
jgi:apolipoprotein N-acyltransferase